MTIENVSSLRDHADLVGLVDHRRLGVEVPPSYKVDFRSKPLLEICQILRVDLLVLTDKTFHLSSHLSLNLQLLHICYFTSQGILSEEVPDQNLLHIGSLAEARVDFGDISLVRMDRLGATLSAGLAIIWFAKIQSLDCVHLL